MFSDILTHKLQSYYTDFIPQSLSKYDEYSKQESPDAQSVIMAEQMKLLAAVDHTEALTLSIAHIAPASSDKAISSHELVELLSGHSIRCLACIQSTLTTFTYPIMNAPYAEGIVQILINVLTSTATQRWLECNMTREQWDDLLERHYQAFAYIVPPVCTIFSCCSSRPG